MLKKILTAEQRFHRMLPGRDIYSKLLFRSIFWFLLLSALYTVLSSM